MEINCEQLFYEETHFDDTKMFDQRKNKRLGTKKVIILVPYAICQVIDLTLYGISFRCRDEHDFPGELSIDIYDTTGLSMEQLQVKKVWEKRLNSPHTPASFLMAVGWEFRNLTIAQESHLKFYLQQLQEIDQ